MSRPGFVLEVDQRTPPLVVHAGDTLRLERFPLGTRVVYGPDEATTVPDVAGRLAAATAAPAGADALRSLLRPDMRLTITFDDNCRTSPAMPAPDLRQLVIEHVLTLAAEAGVDDVELIAAIGLNRRLRPHELQSLLGERVYRSFAGTGQLRNHDAEDGDGLVTLGSLPGGDDVDVSARVADSDLVVHVAVGPADVGLGRPASGPVPAVPLGVCGAATLRRLAGATPVTDRTTAPAAELADLLAAKLPLFVVGALPDRPGFARPYEFLDKREWEYSLRDRAGLAATTRALAAAPTRTRARLAPRLRSPHRVAVLAAGSATDVGERLARADADQRHVDVTDPVDVLVVGLAAHGRFAADVPRNPVLAAHAALRPVFAAAGQPWVRAGGAVIVYHPARHTFSQLHHPSYVDFFDDVLARGETDLDAVEQRYATDPWYAHLYRDSYAVHGTHPVLAWRDVARARAHLRDVIWVGADRTNVARMGFRTATTLADALEIVATGAGAAPSIGYLHDPPLLTPVLRR